MSLGPLFCVVGQVVSFLVFVGLIHATIKVYAAVISSVEAVPTVVERHHQWYLLLVHVIGLIGQDSWQLLQGLIYVGAFQSPEYSTISDCRTKVTIMQKLLSYSSCVLQTHQFPM